ncbi:MAG: hypothetical protein UT34_C0001G0531 [candidate division WS6 bacterium GW2011_GWF2_39_15]|uniref:DUF4153 domain-containing protein n=1 Tax=candidate division WS6 bacterium GW2011_GWF2_39_15 TaxID=1619100 RepID=A0A0G0Q7R5_9BACT|nr:MAG: hypothetical protein UT34_C0001G0531 [candidate division WS6 bacterium GW2011_GWF2_39_15]
MKLSLLELFHRSYVSIIGIFRRFPVTATLIIIEFIGMSLLTELDYFRDHGKEAYLLEMVLLANFALSALTVNIQLASERYGLPVLKRIALNIAAFVLIGGFSYLFLYKDINSFNILNGTFTGNTYKMLIMAGLSVLSVAISPFLKDENSNEWWNLMITTFYRGSISVLYSVALYIGLSLAFLAVDAFWKFTFFDNQYALVAIFSFVLVAPLHFLHGIYEFPKKSTLIQLPKYLLIMVKYILTPLIGIYTIILYPYIFSFPFREEWPANEATGIILALMVMIYAGIALLYGLPQGTSDEKFKTLFTKISTAIALPTILFWIYSLWLRINAYGMTVNRFVLMAVILWFLAVTLYYLFSRNTNIKYPLAGLWILLFVIFYFPFTSFYWGEHSQINRLINIAKDEKLYVNGKIEKGDKPAVAGNDYVMGEIIVYLNLNNGIKKVENVLGDTVMEGLTLNKYGYVKEVAQRYSLSGSVFYANPTNQIPAATEEFVASLDVTSLDILEGYTKVVYKEVPYEDMKKNTFTLDEVVYTVDLDFEDPAFSTTSKNLSENEKSFGPTGSYFTTDITKLSFESSNTIFIINHVGGMYKNGKITGFNFINGYLFTK